jgi:predicted nucleic acid-binding protein
VAGSAKYTAVLDANVLYPRLIRDVLLSLADAELYSARWSASIRAEWTRHLLLDHPDMGVKISAIADAMEAAIPDCMIVGYEHLVESLSLPDADDRHVLAAAIVGHADAIVTLNIRDFPASAIEQFGVEAQTPDEFVLNQIMLEKIPALTAIKRMRLRWQNPTCDALELIGLLERRQLPQTAAHLRDAIELI